jgi:hypothetical protein
MPILSWIQIGSGAAAGFVVSFFLHSLDVAYIEHKHKQEMIEQAKELDARCTRIQLISKDANHDYLTGLFSINNRLGSDLMQPTTCIVLPPSNSSDAPAGGGERAGSHGLNSRWLRKYAATCETYRQERLILEKFIAQTWKENGQ